MDFLLPGFRFYPTEEELIDCYLFKKLGGQTPEFDRVIPSIDIYNFEPSQLPGLAGQLCHGDTEQWFFFVPRQEREARGGRPNRTTATGYWKATGSTSFVYSSQTKIGVKKTMVFYKGKAPTGRKTKWKMNEYKAIIHEDTNIVNNTNYATPSSSSVPKLRLDMSLCRIYVTSGCARAFDRRPMPRTTLTLNTSISTQNEDNNSQLLEPEIIISSKAEAEAEAEAEAKNKLIIGAEKSNRGTTYYYSDNGPNSRVPEPCGTHQDVTPEEGSSNKINNNNNNENDNDNDIHMSDCVDYSFVDWDQLGWI